MSDLDLVRHMHGVTGQYHTHFSTVRTAATALIVPIGLAISVELLDQARAAALGRFPYVLFLFLAGIVVALNVVFSAFSKRCRQIERYLEAQMVAGVTFGPEKHGFRHLFWCDEGTAQGLSPRPRWSDCETWWDVFMTCTAIGAAIYVLAFWIIYAELRP